MKKPVVFWEWFFRGSGASPGWKRLYNRWALFHVVVGIVFALLVPISLANAASTVLLPLAGIFIGLAFAWSGNALALLQSDEIDRLGSAHPGGFEEYVHIFQLAVLVLLTALVAWGVAGLAVLDQPCFWNCGPVAYWSAEAALYALSSLALRECWHVVLSAQLLLLVRHHIRGRTPKP